MQTLTTSSLHWKSRLFNFIVWVIGTPVRRQSSQGLLQELRDRKEKYLDQQPPESFAKTTDLVLTKEEVGADRPGSLWNIWHLSPRETSASDQIVIFFHGGGLYIGVSRNSMQQHSRILLYLQTDSEPEHCADTPIIVGHGIQRLRSRRSQPMHHSPILACALCDRFSVHIHVDRDDTANLRRYSLSEQRHRPVWGIGWRLGLLENFTRPDRSRRREDDARSLDNPDRAMGVRSSTPSETTGYQNNHRGSDGRSDDGPS